MNFVEQFDDRHYWVVCPRCGSILLITDSYYDQQPISADWFKEKPNGWKK